MYLAISDMLGMDVLCAEKFNFNDGFPLAHNPTQNKPWVDQPTDNREVRPFCLFSEVFLTLFYHSNSMEFDFQRRVCALRKTPNWHLIEILSFLRAREDWESCETVCGIRKCVRTNKPSKVWHWDLCEPNHHVSLQSGIVTETTNLDAEITFCKIFQIFDGYWRFRIM